MKQFILTISIIVLMEVGLAAQVRKIDWVLETKRAAWQGRDSQGEFVYAGNLWILGGWDTPATPNLTFALASFPNRTSTLRDAFCIPDRLKVSV